MTKSARRVLIVEDDSIIAWMMEDMIRELGHEVVGHARDLETGVLQARSTDFDFALLDFDLGGGTDAVPIAETLAERGIRFAFATGEIKEEIAANFPDIPILWKPVLPVELDRAIGSEDAPRMRQ